jgi:hypothetical protein
MPPKLSTKAVLGYHQKFPTLKITSVISEDSVLFPAFLTDMTQTFASNWSTEEVYGRNDPIGTFQNTKRTISLSWDLPSATEEDAKMNLSNAARLSQFLYPGYLKFEKEPPVPAPALEAEKAASTPTPSPAASPAPAAPPAAPATSAAGWAADHPPNSESSTPEESNALFGPKVISKPPLVRISFANLIGSNTPSGGLLGWIDSLSFTPKIESGFFGSSSKIYPKVISLSIGFNVLHEEELGFGAAPNWGSRGWPYG